MLILLLDPCQTFFDSAQKHLTWSEIDLDQQKDKALEPVGVELRNKVQNDFSEYRINIYLLIVQTALKTGQFSCQL